MSADEESTEGSPVAGGCVLVVFAGTALAGTWALSFTVAVLTVWGLGAGAVWWAARHRTKINKHSPPPPQPPSPNTKPQFTIVEDREGHCVVQWQKGAGSDAPDPVAEG